MGQSDLTTNIANLFNERFIRMFVSCLERFIKRTDSESFTRESDYTTTTTEELILPFLYGGSVDLTTAVVECCRLKALKETLVCV